MLIRPILTLAGKDWRLFWADGRSALLCFLVPIILASLFGTIFDRPHTTDTNVRLPLLVVCESGTPFHEQLRQDLRASLRLSVEFVSRAEAEQRVAERRPGIATILPPSFDHGAERPRIEFLHHPLCGMEVGWAEGVLTEILIRRNTREQLGERLGDLALQLPFETQHTTIAGSTAFNSYSHSFCGMTLQYLLFWGMESGLLLLRERQRGVWMRLRIGPIPLSAVLIGRAIATAGIALLQVLLTFAFGYFAFGIRIDGSPTGFVLLVLGLCLFTSALGLLVAAIGGAESRARSLSILAILSISMLGGLWLPSFLLPDWLRELSLILPTTWAMRGLEGATWQGRELMALLPSILVVLVFGLTCLLVAVWRFTKMERR